MIMTAFFHYLLFASFSLALCCVIYQVWLRHLSFHRWNRLFILSAILASLLLPFINRVYDVRVPVISDAGQGVRTLLNTTIHDSAPVMLPAYRPGLNMLDVLLGIYLAGVAIMCILLLMNLFRIYRLIHKKDREYYLGCMIIRSTGLNASFFWYIFLEEGMENKMILQHEMAHAYHWHSADLLVVELVKIFFWFNPAVYILSARLRALHEYEADEITAAVNDRREYAHFLLGMHEKAHYRLLHSSAAHPLKSRIKQLFTPKSSHMKKALYLLLIPCLLLAASGFSLIKKRLRNTHTSVSVSGAWNIETRESEEELIMEMRFRNDVVITPKVYDQFFKSALRDMAEKLLKYDVSMSHTTYERNGHVDQLGIKLTNMKDHREAGDEFSIPALADIDGCLIIGMNKKSGQLQVRASNRSVVEAYDMKGIINWNPFDKKC
ncbi:hypothetical protein GO493_00200 [Chitinophaga sp. ysch24]|uniref:Peptidase M56 domain-containing protein n=2 Tax=Chitinophaga tropicalis TaxID=2683588 RepID=A0A7K1TX25_9BACT|nr:hypothetical protein [Chitinophaga tropicalis]